MTKNEYTYTVSYGYQIYGRIRPYTAIHGCIRQYTAIYGWITVVFPQHFRRKKQN